MVFFHSHFYRFLSSLTWLWFWAMVKNILTFRFVSCLLFSRIVRDDNGICSLHCQQTDFVTSSSMKLKRYSLRIGWLSSVQCFINICLFKRQFVVCWAFSCSFFFSSDSHSALHVSAHELCVNVSYVPHLCKSIRLLRGASVSDKHNLNLSKSGLDSSSSSYSF